jgi:hypothetical protein
MDEEMRRAIVAEVVAATQMRVKQPWEFDTQDVMAQCPGQSRAQVYERLKMMWKSGELRSELVHHDGSQVRVFWRAGDVGREADG